MILLTGIGELATMAEPAPLDRDGYWEESGLIADAALLLDGTEILAAGPRAAVVREAAERGPHTTLDLGGRCVTPGLVDPHTHPVFGGSREDEFVLRLKGRPYTEIAAAGGGIRSTVRATRAATEAQLETRLRAHADRFLDHGTTTIEAKSGYGLDTEQELKLLRVIRRVAADHPLDLAPTFLGAHEIPDEWRHDPPGYLQLVIEEMLPRVIADDLAESCDIFCEKGVFEIDASRTLLQAAKTAGLRLRVHADEIAPLGGAELCAELQADSADHLVMISDRGIEALAASGTTAVLLPATSLILRLERDAPGRRMIAAGCRVALATDFNPGTSWCQSMPLLFGLAAARLRLTPFEALRAATWEAARSLHREQRIGALTPGRQADLVVWDCPNHRHLAYRLGEVRPWQVWKRGTLVRARRGAEASAGN
jgi:imidazolonepropionase